MTRACDDIAPQLSLLVDGLLSDGRQAAVRAHVARCVSCRGLLADLERLRATARQLGPMMPPPHAWRQIAEGIQREDRRTAAPPTVWSPGTAARQWVGLAAALVVVTIGLYLVRGTPAELPSTADNATADPSVETVVNTLNLAAAPAEQVIAELEAMAGPADGAMDDAVTTVFRDSLGRIDLTIVESRAALSSRPDSESARDSLFEALRRKIAVLQSMVSLINEMRQGDQEGAARTAEGLGNKS